MNRICSVRNKILVEKITYQTTRPVRDEIYYTMANTYTQIHIQTVFSVQNRKCIIGKQWKDELYKYMTGIIRNHGHKVLAINGMPDHIHVFFGMRPVQSLSDLLKHLKGDSSEWINKKKFIHSRFSW